MPIASPPAPAKSSTLRIEKPPHPTGEPRPVRRLAFPNNHYAPSERAQGALVSMITIVVRGQLWLPKIQSRLRQSGEPATSMAMPEAARDEDYRGAGGKDHIWFPRQVSDMKTIAVAERVREFAHDPFGFRVLRSHKRHARRSLCFGQLVHGYPFRRSFTKREINH